MQLRILILLLLTATLRAQDGIFADFTITSATPGISGTFTAKLHFDKAPRTVANFLSLATGSRTWLDVTSGGVKKLPFYNGITFHRVVSGFVIQGGSPNGLGTDGPGYTFKDEFHPDLRHTAAGILSMANSGLQSNGSQFFITLAATPHLNDVHSVFGEITSGLPLVQAIGTVATNSSGKPNTPVIMQTVAIRRVGPAALAFDEHAHGLPTVTDAQPILRKDGTTFTLRFPRALSSEYILHYGPTLDTTANRFPLGIYTDSAPPEDTDVSAPAAGQPQYYFRVPRIAYPETLYTPFSLAGSTITMTTTVGTIVYTYNATLTAGTCTYNSGTPGAVTNLDWTQEAYRGRHYAETTNLVPILTDLAFTSPSGGNLKGTAYTGGPGTPFTGTFTFTRP